MKLLAKILAALMALSAQAMAQAQRPAFFYHAVDTSLAANSLPSVIASAGFNLLRAKDSTMIFSTGKSWVEYAAGSKHGTVARRITGPGIANFPYQDTLFYKAGSNVTLSKIGIDTLQISASGGAASFRLRDDGTIITSALQSLDFRSGLQVAEPAADSVEVYVAANKGITSLADTLQLLRTLHLSGLAFKSDSVMVDTASVVVQTKAENNALYAPKLHATQHQNGGSDEIDVTGLSGLLADAQKISVRKNSGALVGTRQQLNLIEGSNVTLTIADDPGTPEIDVTIAASGALSAQSEYGEMYVSNNSTALAMTQNAWTRVTGFSAGNLSSTFAFALNGLVTAQATPAMVSVSVSLEATSTDAYLGAVYINAVRDDNHRFRFHGFSQGAITETQVGSFSAIYSLSANDTVRVYVMNLSSDNDPTVKEATVIATNMLGATSESGDITDVGDVSTGAAFTGTQGTQLIFDGGASDGTLIRAALTGARTWTLPNNSGTVAVAATAPVTLSATGVIAVDTTSTIIQTKTENNALYVPLSRIITAGNGLVGGGGLNADRTFDVVLNSGGALQITSDSINVKLDGSTLKKTLAGLSVNSVQGVSGLLADAQKVAVRKNSGAVVGTRQQLNLIEGSNVTLTVADDPGTPEVDITIASTGGAGGGTAQYGDMFVSGNASALPVNQDTWTRVTGFSAGSMSSGVHFTLNGVQVDSAGPYEISFSVSMSASTLDTMLAAIYVNGTRVNDHKVRLFSYSQGLVSATFVGSVSFAYSLAVGDTVRLYVYNSTSGGDPTIQEATVSIRQIISGGTGGGGGAPTNAQYVTMANNGSLTDERVLAGTTNQITVTDGGANGNATLSTPQNIDANANFAANTLSVDQQAGLTLSPYGALTGNTGETRWRELAATGTNYVAFKAPDALASSVAYTLPRPESAVTGYVLHVNATADSLYWDTDEGAGGGAPIDATYITQTANGTLTQEQALGALASGMLASTTTTGIVAARTLTGTAGAVTVTSGDGSANPTFTLPATVTVPTVYAIGTDPADAGVLRLENAAIIGWEASPAGTDVTLTVDASEIMQASGTFNAVTLTENANAVPNSTDHLGFFAATTSAQLAGVLSDESGAAGVFPRFSLTTPAQGDVIYYNGTNWVNLAPGISGYVLHTQGASANPIWDVDDGAGGGAPIDATYITQTANGTLTQEQALGSLATGMMASTTTTGVVATRTLTGTTGAVTITNGDGSGNPTFTLPAAVTVPTSYAVGADPADAGAIMLENAAIIGWEASPTGTDVTLTVNSSEVMTASGTFNAPTLTENGNAVPNSTDNLSFFAATTSAQLAGVLSDESGAAGVFPRFSLTTPAQGDVVYYNGTNWVNLAPGTSGQVLHTQGAAANPIWGTDEGAGGAPVDATYITQTSNGTLTQEQALGLLATGVLASTTTTGVVASRVLTGTTGAITVTSGDGSANPTFTLPAAITVPTSYAIGADPADAGAIRLENAAVIGWEASPTGTDVTLAVDASEIMQSSATFNAPTLTENANAVPNATDHLGFFASTTSAQLAGVLSNETGGSGVAVFNSNPTLAGATVNGGNVSFSDGAGDSPLATFTPATGTSWSIFGQDSDDDFQIQSASTASTENVAILNPGAGTATLTVEGTIGASNFSGSSSGTNTGDQTITLTTDVTGSGTGTIVTTIANDAVTFAKFQNITDARLLGRSAGSGGDMQEITVGTGLSLSGGTLSNTAGGAPASEGYVTMAFSPNLSAERVLQAGNYLDLTDGGANSTATIDFNPTQVGTVTWGSVDATWTFDATTGNNPTLAWTTESLTITADVALKQVSGDISYLGFFENAANGTDMIAIGAPLSVTSSYTMNWPPAQASGNKLLKNNGVGSLSWSQVDLSSTAEVTGTLGIANGGTGLGSTPTNGQLLIGNGSGYTLSTLTEGNYLDVVNSSGSITVAFDPTEILHTTWANGSDTNYLWLFDTNAAAADDPSVTWRGGAALGAKSMRLDDAMAIDLFAGSTMWTLLPNSPSASMLAIRTSFAGSATLAIANDSFSNVTNVDIDGGITAGGSITEGGNAVPNATDNLSFFASTTSAQLASVLSNETGSGLAVFDTSPTLDNPDVKVIKGVNTKTLTEATATNFALLTIGTNSSVGGSVYYEIHADDGGDFQARTGIVNFSIINLASNAESVTIGSPVGEAYVESQGGSTLSVSFSSDATPTNGVYLRASATSSLTQTTLQMRYRIAIHGGTTTVTPQ